MEVINVLLPLNLCLIVLQCQAALSSEANYFDGNAYAEYLLHKLSVNSKKNSISLSFKTVQPNGMLLQGDSTGDAFGDYFTLELLGGKLRFAFSFGRQNGEEEKKSIILGDNLADNKLHTVKVDHRGHKVKVLLDPNSQNEKHRSTETRFETLYLDDFFFIGGAHDFSVLRDVASGTNFKGCLYDVRFSSWNLLSAKDDAAILRKYGVENSCSGLPSYVPFTLNGRSSQFSVPVNIVYSTLRGHFKFRTYKKRGTILHQPVVNNSKNGFELKYHPDAVELYVYSKNPTYVKVRQAFKHTQVNQGTWHDVEFEISPVRVSLTVNNINNYRKTTYDFPNLFFKDSVIVGGKNFVGCLWDLSLNNKILNPSNLSNSGVEIGICNISDFCAPNVCQNGGKCNQDGKEFACDCYHTDYKGPTCQLPKYLRTCYELRQEFQEIEPGNYAIDPDGPGPGKPFQTYCNITATGLDEFGDEISIIWTEVKSKDLNVLLQKYPPEEGSKPESVIRDIRYTPSFESAQTVALASEYCHQFVEYLCTNSKLLDKLRPAYGHWVGSHGWHKYYWGGSGPDHPGKCACGVRGDCIGGGNYWCNCDASRDTLESDEGYLVGTNGKALPVSQVLFGDVNIDQDHYANYSVGSLYCYGRPNNTATFVRSDGVIVLEHREATMVGDHGYISFHFRTPYAQGVLFQQGDVKNGDFIRLEITGYKDVTFSHNIGNGPRSLTASMETSLSDNDWHKVVVWYNTKEFGLNIDGGGQKNLSNPLLLKKQLDLDGNLNIGGHADDRNKGFIGCIRGMTINGKVLDLDKLAERNKHVQPGCKGACGHSYCTHGAQCIDNYDTYRCRCQDTPFYGFFCEKDFGASFKEESHIVYKWPTLQKDAIGTDIAIGFRTAICSGIITYMESGKSPHYFRVSMNNDGKARFEFNVGDGERALIFSPYKARSFCDNKTHTIFIKRMLGKVTIKVDSGRGPGFRYYRIRPSPFEQPSKVIVGGTGQSSFHGCISGVKVTNWISKNVQVPTVEPIKWSLYDHKNTNDTVKVGVSSEKCGPEPKVPPTPTRPNFNTTSPPPKPSEPGDPPIPTRPYNETNSTTTSSAAVMVALYDDYLILINIFSIAAVYVFR